MNKKGGLFDIIVYMIIIFIIFIFFAAWIYGFGLLTTNLNTIIIPNAPANITNASQSTFGEINNALPALKWIALIMAISMVIAIMISNFLVRAHPVFFIVYILITLVAVIFSVQLSNAYESILTASNPLTPTLQSFTAMNFIMLNLPIWITIVGIIGAIFLFIGVTIDREQGGSVSI